MKRGILLLAGLTLGLGMPVAALAGSPAESGVGTLIGFDHGVPVFRMPTVEVTPETSTTQPRHIAHRNAPGPRIADERATERLQERQQTGYTGMQVAAQ